RAGRSGLSANASVRRENTARISMIFYGVSQAMARRLAVTKLRVVCGMAVMCGLVAVAPTALAPTAVAQVEPGGGWKAVSPGFKLQQVGCGKINGLTFSITCNKHSGQQRAERRYDTYSGGTHQFEGSFRIVSMGGSGISLKQTFKTTGPYFLLAIARGGRLYAVGGRTIATGATVGTTVRVNTVHVVGQQLRVYINGSLVDTVKSPSGSFYDKFGAYRT